MYRAFFIAGPGAAIHQRWIASINGGLRHNFGGAKSNYRHTTAIFTTDGGSVSPISDGAILRRPLIVAEP